MFLKLLGILTFFALSTGCTAKIGPRTNSLSEPRLIDEKNYEVGQQATAFVGQPVVKVKKYYVVGSTDRMQATNDFTITGGLASAAVNVGGTAGESFPILATVKAKGKQCPAIQLPGSRFVFGILPDGQFSGAVSDFQWATSPILGVNQYKITPEGTRFHIVTTEHVVKDGPFINYELIFTGISSDTIHLLYREYTIGDLIRPAYSEELNYPAMAKNIRYRHLQIAIDEVTPEKLGFRVIGDTPAQQ